MFIIFETMLIKLFLIYIECNCSSLNHFQSAANQQQNEGLEIQVKGEQALQARKTQVSQIFTYIYSDEV